ncbi:radical SAM protein [candidate division WOR-3 bacterium]|uniref:Radical SAM protein n=1 Tax=candidate division WOR-3 bacterium TaxID=2052148 RepID=A0A9D5QE38_UNCW3|nr:radical SAM protein [candidate division WOR-3 bacterium]MBD3365711.1 radical SAM protein [candidate division WOR-3 bacterium]
MTEEQRQQVVIFEATQRCNLKCRFCYNIWHKHPETVHDDLSPKDTREILGKLLAEARPYNFTVSGGEPTLRTDIIDIILQGALSGATVYLITNGQTLDKKSARRLVRAGVNTFEIQLLSDRAEEHEYLQGCGDSFSRSVEGIQAALKTKARMIGALVLTKKNLPRLAETLRLYRELGIHGCMLNRFNPGGRGIEHLEELSLGPNDVLQMLAVAEEFSARYRYPISCSIPIPVCLVSMKNYPHLGFGFCSVGEELSYPTIDSMGNMRPCNHSPLVIGNIRDKNFWEIMASPVRKRFIDKIPEICRQCEFLSECKTSCRAAAAECGGAEPFVREILKSKE